MIKLFQIEHEKKVPSYSLVITFEHGAADFQTEEIENFEEESSFRHNLEFYLELKDKKYQACNDNGETYQNIVKKFFGEEATPYDYLPFDEKYGEGFAKVEKIKILINGLEHKCIDTSKAKTITLPDVGSKQVRTTYNTNKKDNSKWFAVPKNEDYWKYIKDNMVTFKARVTTVEIQNVYSTQVYYSVEGVVTEGEYKGQKCHWTEKGYDPNF